MTKATFVDPKNCTIKVIEYKDSADLLVKCHEFIGTTDLGHCIPIPPSRSPSVIYGTFVDEWGMDRQFYAFIIKGYPHPIMGPACFYAEIVRADEHGEPDQIPFDFPFEFKPHENLLWMMKDLATMFLVRRPDYHVPVEDPKTKMI